MLKSSNLPRKTIVIEVDNFDDRKITNELNTFFMNIKSKLPSEFPILLQLSNPTEINQNLPWKQNKSR